MPFSRTDGLRPIEELTVPFDSTVAQQRVGQRRRRVRSSAVSLGITVVVLLVIYLWKHDQLKGGGFFAAYGVVLGISVAWFVVYLVGYLLARRAAGRVGSGVAVQIGRAGVEVRGVFVPWPEVTSLAAVPGGWGRSPLLRLERTGGPALSVPFDEIQVRPATLDMTARAYSAGRHGVDLEALEA